MKNSVSLLKKIFSGISVIGALIHSGYAEDLVITFTNGQTEGIPWNSKILGGPDGLSPWGPRASEGTPGEEIRDSSGLIYRNRISQVVIPPNVKTIGERAFASCTNLESVTISEGVEKISFGAFGNCKGLKSIEIPSTVTTVGSGVFMECSNLQTVTFKGENSTNVKIIGAEAFKCCRNLKSFTIPEGVIKISDGAFEGCTGLVSIEIPSTVTTIESEAFTRCKNLQEVTFKGGNCTIIGERAFAFCPNLKSVIILEGVIKISNRAFACCMGLESIVIPSSVTTVEFEAFMGCSNLQNVIFRGLQNVPPEGLRTVEGSTTPFIGSAVFLGCKSLESVVGFDGKDLALPSHAFLGCRSERWAGKYELPCEPMVKIEACLSGVTHKVDVRVPEAYIGACPMRLLILEKALNDPFLTSQCDILSDMEFFFRFEEFTNGFGPDDAFAGRWYLLVESFSQLITSIEIVGNIETLCEQSFKDCVSLKSIKIPSSVTTIGAEAFASSGLTSIEIPPSVTTIGAEAFLGCCWLKSITLHQGLKTIGEGAFDACGLTTISLPQGLTTIGASAFDGCELESIKIPSSVTTIGEGAFRDCWNLKSITLPSGVIQQGLHNIGINRKNIEISIASH